MGKGNRYQGRGGGRGYPHQKNYGGNYNAAPTTATKTQRAITKGLATVFFTFVNPKDTEEFEKAKMTFSRYFLTHTWRDSGLALQLMDEMADQTIAKPVKP